MLLSFQSPYFFTIELQTYLKLALDLAVFLLHNRGTVLFSWINFLTFLYWAITICRAAFQRTSSESVKLCQAPHLHRISAAIRFAFFRFYSPLLTESLLFSFISAYLDASIQRVPSPCGLPSEDGTKSHSKILGSKAAYAYPRLIAVCCVLLRSLESSYPSVGFLLKPFLCSNIPYLFAFAGHIDQNDLKRLILSTSFHSLPASKGVLCFIHSLFIQPLHHKASCGAHLTFCFTIPSYAVIYPWIFHRLSSIRVQITRLTLLDSLVVNDNYIVVRRSVI
jgi:hypothetical protein